MRRCAVLAAFLNLWLPYSAAIGLYGAATLETLPTVASTPALPETSDTVRANYGNYTTRTTLPAAMNLTDFEAPPLSALSIDSSTGVGEVLSASLDPALGLQAVIPYANSSKDVTVTQHFLTSGPFATQPNISVIIDQFTRVNGLDTDAITAWSVTFLAAATITLPGAAFVSTDTAVSAAMADLLQPLVAGCLSNASAVVTVPNNLMVKNGADLDVVIRFTSNTTASAPNATLIQFLAAIAGGSLTQDLHAAATAALQPDQEGGGGSTIPSTSLEALTNATVVIVPNSVTQLPTVAVQMSLSLHPHLSVTAPVPSSDDGLALSSRLQQSVLSGQLAAALEKAVQYPVPTIVDGQNSVFLGRATLELSSGATTLHAGTGIAKIMAASAKSKATLDVSL